MHNPDSSEFNVLTEALDQGLRNVLKKPTNPTPAQERTLKQLARDTAKEHESERLGGGLRMKMLKAAEILTLGKNSVRAIKSSLGIDWFVFHGTNHLRKNYGAKNLVSVADTLNPKVFAISGVESTSGQKTSLSLRESFRGFNNVNYMIDTVSDSSTHPVLKIVPTTANAPQKELIILETSPGKPVGLTKDQWERAFRGFKVPGHEETFYQPQFELETNPQNVIQERVSLFFTPNLKPDGSFQNPNVRVITMSGEQAKIAYNILHPQSLQTIKMASSQGNSIQRPAAPPRRKKP